MPIFGVFASVPEGAESCQEMKSFKEAEVLSIDVLAESSVTAVLCFVEPC